VVSYGLSIIAGYLVGSIPIAYLLVKWRSGVDIRKTGSGNVGAFNTFAVTSDRSLGIIVGVLDGLKGLAVAGAATWVFAASFSVVACGMLAAVVGHIFPLWLKFKGGRGLSTAAGGFFAVGVGYTIVWCTLWFLLNRWKRDIVSANVLASIVTPLLLLAVPSTWLDAVMISNVSSNEYRALSALLSVLLLISHADVIQHMLNTARKHNSQVDE
jgi:glycerol-3-phosphate acyltransferase PlsY